VRQDRQDDIRPVEFGWTNVAQYADYASRDLTLRPDAGRYECGTLNTIGSFGLRASLELLLEVGVQNMAPAIQSLGDRLASGVCAKGYEVMGSRSPSSGAGIVSFRHPENDSTAIVRRLREAGIIAAPRQGWIRMAPHFYISPDDIDRVLAEL
jgi:selenocysteine lyase/cysteine desulfurase